VKHLVTPKQVAQAIGVSESSLKRWCDRGLLATVRTAGGHRRMAVETVIQFLRTSGQPIVRPELLGLPSTTGQGHTVVERARDQMTDALVAGDDEQCRRIVFDLYLAQHSAGEICDQVLAGAFHEIGDRWECGELAVYRERRGCEIALRALYELRSAIPAPHPTKPLAIGGTLVHDPYKLATTMVEVALREAGWRAESYGTLLPAKTLCEAVHDTRPRLVWLSVSAIDSPTEFLADCSRLYDTAAQHGVALAVGGRALDESMRHQMRYSAFCDTLGHLVTFVDTLTTAAAR
jgi:MerR family transcriptional regulator, light-induced transcriptional regulator